LYSVSNGLGMNIRQAFLSRPKIFIGDGAAEMWKIKLGAIAFLTAMLTGCGTYVPGIPEFALQPGSTQRLVQVILDSIHCEIKNSVKFIVYKDIEYATKYTGYRTAAWFDDWGIQGALTLTIKESTEFNPTTSWIPSMLKLGFGLDGSAQATRTEVLNFYNSVDELAPKVLRDKELADKENKACTFPLDEPHPIGSLFINSNLGIREWLEAIILSRETGSTQLVLNQGVTHDVQFQVVTSADFTPTMTFPHVTVNGGGKFLSVMRNRMHELLLTFGPVDKEKKTLVGPAADQFLAGQIGSAINNRLTVAVPSVVVP
jgi:hypothetical protein